MFDLLVLETFLSHATHFLGITIEHFIFLLDPNL